MGKLAVLRLDGDLDNQGFQVTLSFLEEGYGRSQFAPPDRTIYDKIGSLPPDPELAFHIRFHWQETYQNLAAPYRKLEPTSMTIVGSIEQRIKECHQSAEQLCARLNRWLRAEGLSQLKESLLKELSPDEAIRFMIRTEDRQLQKLPWHEWDLIRHYPKAEVILGATEFSKTESPKRLNSQVKILAILGHSKGIDVKADRRLLENLPDAETLFLVEPPRQKINDLLWEQSWDIIFFAGHSNSEGDTGRIYLNPEEGLTIDELQYALRKAVERGLKLAIFNSCDGLGLVHHDAVQIPQIIVMRELVPDQVAHTFLKHFLKAFSSGQPFHLAKREARERLQGLEGEFPCATWLPIIYQGQSTVPLTWQQFYDCPDPDPPASTSRSLWRMALLTSLVMTSLVMWGRWQGHLQAWELKAYDYLMRQQDPIGPDDRIVIVRATQEEIDSLKQPYEETYGERKLSDRTLDRLVEILEKHQPHAIGFYLGWDVGKTSNANSRDRLSAYPNIQQSLRQGRLITLCDGVSPKHPRTITAPQDGLPDNIGFAAMKIDKDETIRRHLLLMPINDKTLCKAKRASAFSLQLALRYFDKANGINRTDTQKDEFLQIGETKIFTLKPHTGGYHHPDSEADRGFQVLLNYRPYRDYNHDIAKVVSITDVLEDGLDRDEVFGRIVLIGFDITDQDRFQTPYTKEPLTTPGVFVQAQQVSHILDVATGKRPLIWTWSYWGDALWIWGWSLVGGGVAGLVGLRLLLTFPKSSRGQFFVRFLAVLGFAESIAFATLHFFCWGFLMQGGWIPFIPSALTLSMTGISVATYKILSVRPKSD